MNFGSVKMMGLVREDKSPEVQVQDDGMGLGRPKFAQVEALAEICVDHGLETGGRQEQRAFENQTDAW